jgi:hypothetical protein
MKQNVMMLMVLTLIFIFSQSAFADEEVVIIDTNEEIPFTIGDPVVNGNGCPEGTYDLILSPDGTELSLVFSQFNAQTEGDFIFDYANCNIAIPIEIPPGITVSLLGIDYHGAAKIPDDGMGMLTREYFFAGKQGTKVADYVTGNNKLNEFFYSDETAIITSTNCGESTIARSNTTLFVSKPLGSIDEVVMSLFSEQFEYSLLFHIEWGPC